MNSYINSKGQRYGWSRDECDNAFRRDMETICTQQHGSRKRGWSDVMNALAVAGEIAKWPKITNDLAHCKHGAKIYYLSVKYFGASNYEKTSPSWCNEPCSKAKGSP